MNTLNQRYCAHINPCQALEAVVKGTENIYNTPPTPSTTEKESVVSFHIDVG